MWQLLLSSPKCIVQCFGSDDIPSYNIAGVYLEVVSDHKDLGIIMSSCLKFDGHIVNLLKKAKLISSRIFRSFINRNPQFLIKMFIVFVRPVLEYNSVVWSPYLIKNIDLLESVQRQYTKRIPGLQQMTYAQRLSSLDLDSLERRRLIFDLIFVYKVVHKMLDISFDDLFCYAPGLGLRGHPFKLAVRRAKTNLQKTFISYRVISAWNNLPLKLVNSTSLRTFKSNLAGVDLSSYLRGTSVTT